MKKEEWINDILESSSEIHEAEVNPFLYQKIVNRLREPEKTFVPSLKYNLNWAFAISMVLVFNLFSLVIYNSKIHKNKEGVAIESLKNEMISSSTYNY